MDVTNLKIGEQATTSALIAALVGYFNFNYSGGQAAVLGVGELISAEAGLRLVKLFSLSHNSNTLNFYKAVTTGAIYVGINGFYRILPSDSTFFNLVLIAGITLGGDITAQTLRNWNQGRMVSKNSNYNYTSTTNPNYPYPVTPVVSGIQINSPTTNPEYQAPIYLDIPDTTGLTTVQPTNTVSNGRTYYYFDGDQVYTGTESVSN